jgi:BirA family biotin operon repressor/biotin-[acetyl-CoA-carboxylase] ligase
MRKRGDLYAPAIVLTGSQTTGRGRGTNTWWSARGVLTVTFVFPLHESLAPHQIPLIAGLAVRDAAAELCGEGAIQLKWPNDLLHEKRKLAGLLCERLHRADLVGVGMNVSNARGTAPLGLRGRITSLSQIAGRSIDMTDAVIALSRHLRLRLGRHNETPFSQQLREYDAHHALVGESVTVAVSDRELVMGRCEGLDGTGRLLVRGRDGLHRIIAGEVRWASGR